MIRMATAVTILAHLAAATAWAVDLRDITQGHRIPDEGYCDQPYVVITKDGDWLCTLTTGTGLEGQGGQHVVSTISRDQGRTWSPLVDIEPADGPAASWVVPFVATGGRVYAFYTYNGDHVHLGRDDVHGWYAMKISDDGGRSWSSQRYRLPLRRTACDTLTQDGQLVQMFWGIDKPKVAGDTVVFGFTKLGRYFLGQGEGWLFASDNLLAGPDPQQIRWQLRPEGERGIRGDAFGSIQEEHNLVPLGAERLYCVYRTTLGFPCHSYSDDGGRTWTDPTPMTYTPDGRLVRTPRACPKLWRCENGKFLFWYHLHGGPNFSGQYPQPGGRHFQDRNPAWIAGGVLKQGRLHWSQPEILLYHKDPQVRMSYPDLIEQDGRYWVTETQKTEARIHPVDSRLVHDLWAQLEDRLPHAPVAAGRIADLAGRELAGRELAGRELAGHDGTGRQGATPPVTIDQPLTVAENSGFTVELWLTIDRFNVGQTLLDTRDEQGRGWAVALGEENTLRLLINDGVHQSTWACDSGMLRAGQTHHVVFVVDGGPDIISVVVDGAICDGGGVRQFGWGRFSPAMGDVSGTGRMRTQLHGTTVHRLRIYGRYLRTSEVVQNYRAGWAESTP